MALRSILTKEDERLRKKCRPVTEFNERLQILLDDLYETLQSANGAGIAAPQVGILRRALVIDIGEGKIEMVNPVLVDTTGEQCSHEGCLSIPGEWGMVKRPQKVKVKAQDREGNFFEMEAEDYLAVAVCHEIDHLEGILYTDRAYRMLTEDELEDEDE